MVELLRTCNEELLSNPGQRVDARKETFRSLLAQKRDHFIDFDDGPMPVIVAPSVMATDLLHDKATVFSSACMPQKIRLETAGGALEYIDFMFKSGDDLRQDQLVMQVIKMCDDLLKRENVDLEVVTYRVLATELRDGMIEFVPNAMTLYDIQKEFGGIIQFLHSKRPDPQNKAEIDPKVLDTYVKSTAAYCVFTYLLGVGDRHLENLMLTESGNLFHIDFGFILGRKPFAGAAPTRITHEMVETMGGLQSQMYARFKSFAIEAFNCLRKHAGEIMRLLLLMRDAGIANGNTNATGDFAEANLEEQFEVRFCLSKSDEDAAADFERLLVESPYAFGSRAHDFFHDLKVRGTR